MVTIYFDKQVFSHLFQAKEEKYSILLEKILSHKRDFIFLYSDAHLFDLQRDVTDIKYDEMDFMQSIVDGNHMIYESSNLQVVKESPRAVFDNMVKMDDIFSSENIDVTQITQEQCDVINNSIDLLLKDLSGQLEPDWLKQRIPISSVDLQMDKETLTSCIKFVFNEFYKKKELYKEVRDIAINNYNPEQITADGENIFNNQLVSSPLGLSFTETIKATLKQLGLTSCNAAIVYYISYMLLDLLGVCKEARKKVRFYNMQVDCCHSFFGSYCDCFVSDDVGVLEKSKTLYKLFNIKTQIYSIDDFIEKFDEAINNHKKSVFECFDEICIDYRRRKVAKIETISKYTVTHLCTSHEYFGYFNYMLERKSEDETILMLHKNNNVNQPILIQEIEIIVNRLVCLFNSDNIGIVYDLFDKDIEIPRFETDNWCRSFLLNIAEVGLTKFKQSSMLCLWIKFKQPIIPIGGIK